MIDEIEKLLNTGTEVEMLPNGEIRVTAPTEADKDKPKVPLTMKQDLGGVY